MRFPVFIAGTVVALVSPWFAQAQDANKGSALSIGGEKAVLVRQSKSPDGRYALAWTLKEKESADWSLLESDLQAFYKEHEADAIWVVDVQQARKLDTLVSGATYIRPGTHRTLAAAWGENDSSGRRFALGAFDWKWGTDTIYLIDVGAQDTKHIVIGPTLDAAVAAFLKRTTPEAKAALNISYLVAGLPEKGTKTGFTDPSTVQLPFNARESAEDRPLAEGVLTLKLSRAGGALSVTVGKIVKGATTAEPFGDNVSLAKADAELNAVYTALVKKTPAAKRDKLKEEQRAWIEQRDKQAAETPVDAGDSARVQRDRALTQLTLQRIAELKKAAGGKK